MQQRSVMLVRLGLVAGLVAGLGVSGSAWGQSEDGVLRGPVVEERGVPGVRERYVSGVTDRMMGYERPIALPAYLGALRSLHREGVPASLRLTEAQVGQIQGELRDFGEALRAFVREHEAEIRAIVTDLPRGERGRALVNVQEMERLSQMLERMERAGLFAEERVTDRARRRAVRAEREGGEGVDGERPERERIDRERAGRDRPDRAGGDAGGESFRLRIREGRDAGGSPDAGDGVMTEGEEMDPGRRRLEMLREVAPTVQALQTRLWELLREDQREVVGEELARIQREERARQEERRLRADLERREAERATDAAPGGDRRALDLDPATIDRLIAALEGGEIPERVWLRLPERMRQRLEGLPAEDRAAALRRALASRRGSDRPGGS